MARFAFGKQLALDHHLRGNSGMIGARLPECVMTTHAMITREGIHDSVVKGVTHMQRTGDIGWRQHDAERLGAVVHMLGLEITGGFPVIVPARFYRFRVVGLVHDAFVELAAVNTAVNAVRIYPAGREVSGFNREWSMLAGLKALYSIAKVWS